MKRNDILGIFDNEGPQTQNDNAQESMVALAKECGLGEEIGVRVYQGISNIDDIWGDFNKIPKDPLYSSGHTLKVVLPFFRAMDATFEWLLDFAKKNIRVVPDIKKVLRNLNNKYNIWQISTSYSWFIQAFCDLVDFDFEKSRCTFVHEFDEIPIVKEEAETLKDFMKLVATWPVIQYDQKTGEVAPDRQHYYDCLTGFIWEFVYYLPVGKLLRNVYPVGQAQKRTAMIEIIQKTKTQKGQVFFVGDSQTDVKCVQYLEGAGLTMMFNGKGKVCDESDLMYIGESAKAIEEVADLFAEHGREWVIGHYTPPRQPEYGGLLAAVTPQNLEKLKEMSVAKRKEFRGIHIGELT